MKNFIIGVEGEVASGKSSICKQLTKVCDNTVFIDGGLIYRAIIQAVKNANLSPLDFIRYAGSINKLKNGNVDIGDINSFDLMERLKVEFKIEDNISVIYIAGEKVDSEEIHSVENDMAVSKYAGKADNSALFEFAKKMIAYYSEKYNVVVSARGLLDIYQGFDAHVYITADIDERVNRRFSQFEGKYSKEELKELIKQRDDLHEESNFNKMGDISITVDVTETKTIESATEKVIKALNESGLVNIKMK